MSTRPSVLKCAGTSISTSTTTAHQITLLHHVFSDLSPLTVSETAALGPVLAAEIARSVAATALFDWADIRQLYLRLRPEHSDPAVAARRRAAEKSGVSGVDVWEYVDAVLRGDKNAVFEERGDGGRDRDDGLVEAWRFVADVVVELVEAAFESVRTGREGGEKGKAETVVVEVKEEVEL